jgi:hypothetical protein
MMMIFATIQTGVRSKVARSSREGITPRPLHEVRNPDTLGLCSV